MKLFLTKRDYLSRFKRITEQSLYLDPASEEINVSFLQVLAILSFEKENHNALKSPDFLKDILKTHIFKKIDKMVDQSEDIGLKKED